MRKITVIAKPRRIPVVQQPRILTAEEQQVRAELKAKLYTSILMHRLQQAII
jgi:hypothetical protein